LGNEEFFVRIAGIICEYNPFHNGHAHQLAVLREAGYAPVCVMSGDYVQRGEPAVIPAAARAEAAVRCGAALVLELPPSYALRSAEGFADGGVELLDRLGCAEALCFGSESGDAEALLATARTLLSPELVPLLKQELAGGASFPAARQRALERLGAPGAPLLERPNSILAVEYCKALLRRGSRMRPIVLHRAGDYHGGSAADAPSASFLRGQVDWAGYMPEAARAVQAAAPRYRLAAGERAVLARLRAMGEDEFAAGQDADLHRG
jgi:predicted nucleotidyltransferase